jgi:threonine dehydrogenase-like Zn-dependent dehydrogenase
MKAVRYEAPGDFTVIDVPTTARAACAHQDPAERPLRHGPAPAPHDLFGVDPLTPGHETIGEIGEIDEVGAEVTRFRPGDLTPGMPVC